MRNTLLSSEDAIKILAENTPQGVLVFQDDHVVLANQGVANLHGCDSPLELIGRHVYTLGHHSKSEFEKVHQNSKMGLNYGKTFRWQGIGIGGREFDIEARPNNIIWRGRSAIISVATDLNMPAINDTSYKVESPRKKPDPHHLCAMDVKSWCSSHDMVGQSKVMKILYEKIKKASQVDFNILVQGESGTGKELVARAIHYNSSRRQNRFVAVNSTAINEHLFESEFFGHMRGAFTGAVCNKCGYFCEADGGTLFLDEIGDLSLKAQTKLLRVFDNGEYIPVGNTVPKTSNARIIMATNRDLVKLVETGQMREDFYFRACSVIIDVPPLRERLEDIPFLIANFFKKNGSSKTFNEIPKHIMAMLSIHHWPGNVRELQNVISRYITLGEIGTFQQRAFFKDYPHDILGAIEMESEALGVRKLSPAVDALERLMIVQALTQYKGNKSKAADHLGVPRRTFLRKVKKYELS